MTYDQIVIGAGISGAAAAYELSAHGSVLLLEAEASPGVHSTGRSAALYTRNYGGPVVRRINAASRAFFVSPPDGFCDGPLLSARGALTIAAPGEERDLDPVLALSSPGAEVVRLTAHEACDLAPVLRPERVGSAAFEAGVMDIDVARLHQGYLRGLKRRGGDLAVNQRAERLDHGPAGWRVGTRTQTHCGRIVVNAAGAWAGQIGLLAEAADIGLEAKRRTAILVDAPAGMAVSAMPTIDFVGCDAYIKPEAGKLMASPGDQTPVEPQDIRPDEMDMAVLVDWLERETFVAVRRIAHSWAGLQSFVLDDAPVVGFDAQAPDFFWLAGQGGYGIMMAPALGRATSALILHGRLPEDLLATGIVERDLASIRLF